MVPAPFLHAIDKYYVIISVSNIQTKKLPLKTLLQAVLILLNSIYSRVESCK